MVTQDLNSSGAFGRGTAAVRRSVGGFTMVEVMFATLMIGLSIGSIMAINTLSIHTLEASREAAATSQVLQERLEMIRDRSWTEVANGTAMAALMRTATESERELTDSNFSETMKVTVPVHGPNGPTESARFFSVRRTGGTTAVEQAGDFSTEPTLFFEGTATWRTSSGVHQRKLRCIICRNGLTRSGIVGSVLGRPGTFR